MYKVSYYASNQQALVHTDVHILYKLYINPVMLQVSVVVVVHLALLPQISRAAWFMVDTNSR